VLFKSNSLLINPGKTKFLLFGTKQALAKINLPLLQFLGEELTPVRCAKDLGIIMANVFPLPIIPRILHVNLWDHCVRSAEFNT
jgi:hypothetical protein